MKDGNPEQGQTINTLIDKACAEFARRPAVGFTFEPPLSHAELHDLVIKVAGNLQKAGLKKGDRIAILAENSPAWGCAYLGTVRIGAVAVPILPDFPAADVKHILADTGTRLVFTTQRQLEKLHDFASPGLKAIVTLDDSADPHGILTTAPFSAAMAGNGPPPGIEQTDAAEADDLASIIYTSGTSGHAKGVMLTHANFCANVKSAGGVVRCRPEWKFLSVLPLSHAYEFTIGFLFPLLNGARIIYARTPPSPTVLRKICATEQPEAMAIVPMVMEKIYKKQVLSVINRNRLLKILTQIPLVRRQVRRAAGKKLRAFFGGRLELAAIGGAALNPEVEAFLAEAEFPYLIGYGLTETAPLLCAGPFGDSGVAIGSTGKPVPGVEIRISTPAPGTGIGQILARGANVMKGYLNNPEATRAAIDGEGWLATGDLGFMDSAGNLHITGRSKNVIVLSHGENIYPETIEEKINAFQHVLESLVVENNDRLEAWIYLDYELIDAETLGLSERERQEYIAALLGRLQQETNRQLPPYAQIARFVERPEPFIKTATQKIKRYLYASGPDPAGPQP